ncbi:MAG TPA: hypothetical protein VGN47_03390 [Blastococcus sp.]|jgi:hypothetical protein|nr:hypothetical protein [Blastococcus sp.]
MRGPLRKATLVLLTVGGLVTVGMSPALADESHSDRHHHEIEQTVRVVGTGSSVQIDRHTIQSGSIHFAVRTTNPTAPDGSGGSQISLWKPRHGASVRDVLRDLQDEFSQTPSVAAKGTRELTHDAVILGLADVVKGYPEVVTEFVAPGTYFLMDLSNPPKSGPPALTALTVRPAGKNIEQDSDLDSQVSVRATSSDRFIAPRDWPHQGTYTFTNVSDTLHFMAIQPVKRGTTDKQISTFFSGPQTGPPSFFVNGPGGGNDVVTPGRSLQVTYHLPPGTYVLLCFVADDVTGMPHAVMGMHKVVVLH